MRGGDATQIAAGKRAYAGSVRGWSHHLAKLADALLERAEVLAWFVVLSRISSAVAVQLSSLSDIRLDTGNDVSVLFRGRGKNIWKRT